MKKILVEKKNLVEKKFWFFIKKKNLVLFFARKSEPLSARIGTVPIIARKSEPKKGYIEPFCPGYDL